MLHEQHQQTSRPPQPSDQGHGGELMGHHAMDGGGTNGGEARLAGEVDARKLVILGLPWDTTEGSLERYFSQIGPLQEVVIMKDRSTGKSRGFGFVTFFRASDAAVAANQEHVVDNRRCEAKYALPRGGGPAPRTTRIFVARIPLSVGDAQFRAYFEQFGQVQDAYMPKDASKQSHRGIGFVTFASADPVEAVMSAPHSMNGQELAIDRATPKEKVGGLAVGGGIGSASRLREIQQIAAAAAVAAYPAAAYASLASAGSFSGDMLGAGVAGNASTYMSYGTPSSGLSYSAAVNNFGSRAASGDISADGAPPNPPVGSYGTDGGGGYANGAGATPTYSSGGGSSAGGGGASAVPMSGGYENGSQAHQQQARQQQQQGGSVGSGGSGGEYFPAAMRADGGSGMGDAGPAGSRGSEVTLQDYRGLVGGDHTAQALQGLTFGGSSEGIGIGLGIGMLQAAHMGQPQQHAAQQPFQFKPQASQQQQQQMGGDQAEAHARAQAILRSLAGPQGARSGNPGAGGVPGGLTEAQLAGLLAGGVDAAQLVSSIVNGGMLPGLMPPAPPRPAHRVMGHGGRAQMGGGMYGAGTGSKPAVDTRSGPRIFVGKLNKETSENDVKDYFTRFGYVMDVYLPRDKVNRAEHRGFGFVTFETEAAVLRIHAHGQHQIKGSVVAIDSAVPRREEGARTDDDLSTSSMVSLSRGLPSVPSIHSLGQSPGHSHSGHLAAAAAGQGGQPGGQASYLDSMPSPTTALEQVLELNGEDLSMGPARHHPQERMRHGYKPY